MGRTFASGSSECGSYASGVITALPCTLFAWFKASSVSGGSVRRVVTVNASGTTDHYISLYFTASTLYAQHFGGGDGSAGASISAGVWNCAAGVYTSTTSRALFLNGTLGSANTTSVTSPSGINCVGVGKIDYSGGAIQFYDGDLADVALWDAALSADELTALYRGARPHRIRPGNLKAYWPLIGIASPEPDYSTNRQNLTMTGTTRCNHAPVGPTSRQLVSVFEITAAPTTWTASGTISLASTGVSGATVRIWDETDEAMLTPQTTDGSGEWSIEVPIGHTIAVAAEYSSGGTDYTTDWSYAISAP